MSKQELNAKIEALRKEAKDNYDKFRKELHKMKQDIDKPEIEVGKWYWIKLNKEKSLRNPSFIRALINYQGEDKMHYGFDHCGLWEERFGNAFKYDNDTVTEATPEEVFEALKNEAVRRGFVDTKDFKADLSSFNGLKVANYNSNSEYKYHDGVEEFSYDKWCIFRKGKWATVIEEPKEMFVNVAVFGGENVVSEIKYSKEEAIDLKTSAMKHVGIFKLVKVD